MQKVICLIVVALFLSTGAALAVSAKKTIEFNKSPMGTVIFDGTIHKEQVRGQPLWRLSQRQTCF
jgi:hypothetical protein